MTSSELSTESVSAKVFEAGVQTLSISEKKIGFLDLPGELRNIIYDLISASVVEEKENEVHLRHSSDVTDWSSLRRQDLGLTQTCSLIRNEYLPIFSSHHTMYIPIYRLAWYTDALEKAESPKPPVLPSGKVLIGVRARFQLYDWHSSSVDISSLLRAYKEYPDWKLEFDFPKFHPLDPFAKLFSVRVNEKWWNRLQTQVKEVNIWLHENTKAHIIVRYGEPWMVSRKKGKKGQMDRWLTDTAGLPGLGRWNGMRVYVDI